MEEVEGVGVVVVDQQRAHRRAVLGSHSRAGGPVSKPLRVAVLGSTGGWHAQRLEHALTARGHTCEFAPVTRMVGRIDGSLSVRGLDGCDVVLVRGIPRGSLEQVVFRVDALHALAAGGVRAVNGAHAIERTVDKFLASALLAQRGSPHAADDRLRARRRRAGRVLRARRRRDRQATVRLDGPGHGARRGPGRRAARVPSARARARRLLPAGDPPPRRPRRASVRGRRPRGGGDRARRRRLAGEPGPGRAGSAVTWTPSGRSCACGRPRRSAPTTRAWTCCGRPRARHVLEVNGIPGWSGVEKATGVDVAGALVSHLERLVGS